MDLVSILSQQLKSLCCDLFDINDLRFDLVVAKKKLYGDFSANIAFILAKTLKKSPLQIADQISAKLVRSCRLVEKCEVAGGGFVNIWLKSTIWKDLLLKIYDQSVNFGFEDIGKGARVHIEFVSANPTGPLHLGHIRGAVIFDTIAEILKKSNFSVVKEYYINDAGKQVDYLMKSIFLRYKEKVTGVAVQCFPEYCYPGDYIKDIASDLEAKYNAALLNYNEEEFAKRLKTTCIDCMMDLIKSDLAKLNITYDCFTHESYLHKCGYVEKAITLLQKQNLIVQEELEKPKGVAKDWQRRNQLVFLAKKFGDDENRSLQKADGDWTYFASDLAYHFFKIERGFNQMIIGLGADHAGYVKRLKGLVNALSNGNAEIDVKLYNIVNLFENGNPIKLSKRKGNIVGLKDVSEKGITCQELRFALLTKGSDSVLDFDIAKFLQTSEDNPIFYVQYASARCSSVLKKYVEHDDVKNIKSFDISLFTIEQEWDLIKTLARWPSVVKVVVQTLQVHKLVFYAQDVAEKFHSLWNIGITNTDARFIIQSDLKLTRARIFLVQVTKNIISCILGVLKIEAVDQM